MKSIPFMCLTLSLALLAGCGKLNEPDADVARPNTYNKDGLQFKYPGNWKVEVVKDGILGVPQVNVGSPSTSSIIIHVFPAKDAFSLEEYANRVSRATMSGAIFDDSNRTAITKARGFEIMTDYYFIKIIDETLTHQRVLRRKQMGDQVLFLTSQTSMDKLGRAKPGFNLVANSVTLKATPETSAKAKDPSTSPAKEANKTQPKTDSEPGVETKTPNPPKPE